MKQKFVDVVISHSTEIISAVVVGVVVTVISSYLLEDNEQQGFQPDFTRPVATNRSHFVRANLAQVVSALSPVNLGPGTSSICDHGEGP